MRSLHCMAAVRRALVVGGGIAIAAAASSAGAADWSVNPKLTGSFEYNDNTRMSEIPTEQVEVEGAAVDAAVELRADGQTGFFRAYPRARATFFPGDETEETQSWWLQTDGQHIGEKSQLDIRADYSSIETLGPYLPLSDPGGPIGQPDPGEGTGGHEEALNREDRLIVAPTLQYSFTERQGLEVGAGYVDVSFDQQIDADREDFSYIYGNLGYVYRLSPTKSITFSVEGSEFENEDGLKTNAQEASFRWTNKTSEQALFYFRLGASRAEDDVTGDWDEGFSGGVGVDWAFEVSKVSFEITSDIDPNAAGRLVQRDQLRLAYEYRLSEALTAKTVVRYLQDEGTGDADEFETRKYANATVGLDWRFARQWTLGGAYTYVYRDFENDLSSADANRFSLGITYEPHRL